MNLQQLAWNHQAGNVWAGPQRGRTVKIERPGQAALPHIAVLGAYCIGQPAGRDSLRRLAMCRAKRHEEFKQAPKVALCQKFLSVWPNQKVHVGTGFLLGKRMLQLPQKSARMG